jgi:hypothetical protein
MGEKKMNGRIEELDTPEERLAAVARSLAIQMEKLNRTPDYADYRDALRPFILRELLLTRIDEARKGCGRGLTGRIQELDVELKKLTKMLPDRYRL